MQKSFLIKHNEENCGYRKIEICQLIAASGGTINDQYQNLHKIIYFSSNWLYLYAIYDNYQGEIMNSIWIHDFYLANWYIEISVKFHYKPVIRTVILSIKNSHLDGFSLIYSLCNICKIEPLSKLMSVHSKCDGLSQGGHFWWNIALSWTPRTPSHL